MRGIPDAATGERLWSPESLGATVMTSTITYSVDGRQYVTVVNGNAVFGPPQRLSCRHLQDSASSAEILRPVRR